MKKSKQNQKTVYLDKVGIFWNQKDGRIRITFRGTSPFISTVSPDPKSKRGNPNLLPFQKPKSGEAHRHLTGMLFDSFLQ